MIITIPGKLPSLNEVINKNRTNRYVGAKFKKDIEQLLCLHIKNQCKAKYERIMINIVWYEPNRKRDFDNIASSKKFILDSLVKCEVIPNDGWKNLHPVLTDHFFIDKDNPRVEIFIEEVK